jgi:tetratricopeptide (TPR) repeat protein
MPLHLRLKTQMRRKVFLAAALSVAIITVPAPGRAVDSVGEAQARFAAGSYAAAIDILKDVLRRHPGDAGAHFWMGRCYYELHDYANAVAQAAHSVELAPDNSRYHQWLGRAYGGKAEREKSFFLARRVKKELEKAVALDPSNIGARRDLQRFYMEAPWIIGGSGDKALGMADAVAAADPVEGRLAHAEYYLHILDDAARAGKEYRSVLTMKPRRVGQYFEAADFYAQQEDAAGLERAVRIAAGVNPTDARLSYYRGVTGVVGDSSPKAAEKELQTYLHTPERSDWPSHADAREWLGRLFEREGRPADAAAEYQKALAEEPARSQTRARLERLETPSRR